MRNPNRIPKVLKEIEAIWIKYPDLRLMQLIGNCYNDDPYYIEDDSLIKKLKETYNAV